MLRPFWRSRDQCEKASIHIGMAISINKRKTLFHFWASFTLPEISVPWHKIENKNNDPRAKKKELIPWYENELLLHWRPFSLPSKKISFCLGYHLKSLASKVVKKRAPIWPFFSKWQPRPLKVFSRNNVLVRRMQAGSSFKPFPNFSVKWHTTTSTNYNGNES